MSFDGKIGHLEDLNGPWANAGGVIGSTNDVEAMAKTGAAWLEDGSQTELGRPGLAVNPENPDGPSRTVYTHNVLTGETGNARGMPGDGMDIVEQEIPERVRIAEAYDKKYVLNIAPVSTNPAPETYDLVRRGYQKGAHAVLVNAGCPNVLDEDGVRMELLSRDEEKLRQVLDGLRPLAEKFKPVFLRLSPQETYEHAARIFKVIRDSGTVSAVFVSDTWPNFVPRNQEGKQILEVSDGAGGLSGPAVAKLARQQTLWATEFLHGTGIDVVSSAGIMNAKELSYRLDHLGAKGGAGTTFYYEPAYGAQEDTDRLLKELSDL